MNGFESALALFTELLRLITAPTGYGIAVWILAIIFMWSGLAKLRRPTLAAMAMMDFRVVRRVRPRLGGALGAAELLLALSLIAGVLPGVFLPVTAGLLWFFVLLIVRGLHAGDDFACFCFGDSASRLSHLTLVRTVALALLASVLAVSARDMYASFSQAYLLQALSAAAFIGTIVLGTQIPRLLRWNNDPYGLANRRVN